MTILRQFQFHLQVQLGLLVTYQQLLLTSWCPTWTYQRPGRLRRVSQCPGGRWVFQHRLQLSLYRHLLLYRRLLLFRCPRHLPHRLLLFRRPRRPLHRLLLSRRPRHLLHRCPWQRLRHLLHQCPWQRLLYSRLQHPSSASHQSSKSTLGAHPPPARRLSPLVDLFLDAPAWFPHHLAMSSMDLP